MQRILITKQMLEAPLLNDLRGLNSLHYGDLIYLADNVVPTYNYDTGQFDGDFVAIGQYYLRARGKISGVDVIVLCQEHENEGRKKTTWYLVSPNTSVYLLQEKF